MTVPVAIPPFTVNAFNVDTGSANRMHAAGMPEKLGFAAPLVVGLGIYGQMTRGLVRHFGAAWLERGMIAGRFLKPVRHGEPLTMTSEPIAGREHERAYLVTARNAEGAVTDTLTSWLPEPFPAVDPLAHLEPVEWDGERKVVHWDLLELGRPFRAFRWAPAAEDSAFWWRPLQDDQPIYTEGPNPPLHPTLVARHTPMGFNAQFIFDTGVHASSTVTVHRALRVGQAIEALTVPVDKSVKKENQWVTFYSAVRADGEVAAEIRHTMIFRLRGE